MSQPVGAKVTQLYQKAAVRVDSWINTVTGLGTQARDKVFSAFFQRSFRLTDQELEDVFNGDDLAAKIAGKVVEDSLRGGYELVIGVDEETSETVAEAAEAAGAVESFLEDELHATQRVRAAWTWGRLFGGAVLYLVTDEGRDIPQDEPLDEARLRKVLALTVLDKRDLIPFEIYDDPADPKFGAVKTYRVNSAGPVGNVSAQIVNVTIHETRLIIFEGALTTNRERQSNQGWALSVLQRPYDVLRTFNTSFQALANILQDASQGIFEMEGLIDMIASGEKEAVQTRMALVDLQRSVARSLVIDAEKEKFSRLTPALTGYPEALEILMLRLAAAADMPVAVLFGRAPAGLNATGESDRLLWAQTVESEQTQVADPTFTRLAQLVFLSSDGPTNGRVPDSWDVVFPPLVHQTETERVDNRKTVAEADKIYVDIGVLIPEEVALNRFKPTGFSAETSIETKERELMLAEEMDRFRGEPAVPPVTGPEPVGVPGATVEPTDPQAVDPQTALNGAQFKELQAAILSAADGTLPKETVVRMIAASFPFTEAEAARILEPIKEPTETAPTPVPAGLTPSSPPGEPGPTPPTAEPSEEDDDRTDQGHVHSIPGGGVTGVSDVQGSHTHSLPGGGQTGAAQTGAGHTHSLPDGGRTGGPQAPN